MTFRIQRFVKGDVVTLMLSGDIASDAGAEAENAIIATLRAAFPDDEVVAEEGGGLLRLMQTGRVQQYAAVLFGAAGLVALALILFVT